jgi:hypothetical protein
VRYIWYWSKWYIGIRWYFRYIILWSYIWNGWYVWYITIRIYKWYIRNFRFNRKFWIRWYILWFFGFIWYFRRNRACRYFGYFIFRNNIRNSRYIWNIPIRIYIWYFWYWSIFWYFWIYECKWYY